ncbi:hypothetical protein K443DRAFT_162873 [Laccaria amethystina LaAM-08-1]|uniref:Unplaced genomic scaffold K443scaffold_108, whole genome shotgun sequence n=1 Tax=Laccaria amethystina LaAM-08-1 TaxID=1095629 RepID=A0A0C9X3M5_9AGAR|nr:hypothetical protein K443DRAFT_162873 [Laccaria amethystina LaAM-08-1]
MLSSLRIQPPEPPSIKFQGSLFTIRSGICPGLFDKFGNIDVNYMQTCVEISTWNNLLDTRHVPSLCLAPLTMSVQ